MKRNLISYLCVLAIAVPALAGNGLVQRAAKRVDGSYIVILDPHDAVAPAARSRELTARFGGTASVVWDKVRGFGAKMTEGQAQALSNDPHVLFVEEDGIGSIISTTQTLDTHFKQFHIDRIDQRNLPADSTFTWCQDGSGVTIYIVDSGTWGGNDDFHYYGSPYGYRVSAGADFIDSTGYAGNAANPCRKTYNESISASRHHGTIVASAAAGVNYGVAKNAAIVPVRVADCYGQTTYNTFVSGLNWILNHGTLPGVVNISLIFRGGQYSEATLSSIDYTVNMLIDSGFVVVAGAGNDNNLSTCCSPQRVDRVLTVGGSDYYDRRWIYSGDWHFASNWGAVDLFAPAVVSGAGIDYASQVIYNQEGTSFAGPLVAGIAAQYLQLNPTATPATVNSWIVGNATPNVLDPNNLMSVNLLAYSFCQ
jgi:hypothetical protein